MTVHIFIGAGPANLHRALKIKTIDSNAALVIVDGILQPDTRSIDRERARANIFHFEVNVVTEQLIEDGVDKALFAAVSYERDFSVAKGFQYGDDNVFSSKRFTEIQIRDLQQLLLQALDSLPGRKPMLVAKDMDIHASSKIEQVVANLLFTHQAELSLGNGVPDIQIHTAIPALKQAGDSCSKVYAVKDKYRMLSEAPDSAAVTIMPTYGTTTFFIKDPNLCAQYVSCRELEKDQRSLDATDWHTVLRGYGWDLIRPPRVRVFYANDVLYIGAEIPAKMMALSDDAFQDAVTNYTRAIASLVFPHTNISELPVNSQLHARSPKECGVRDQVLSTTEYRDMAWGEGRRPAHIQVFNHGHSRYLSHYQTGSGFVTAFLQNEVYAGIYQQKTLHDLFIWALENKHISVGLTEDKLEQHYVRALSKQGDIATREKVFQVFQTELFMAISKDIIDENQAVVGRYFNAIHAQVLVALEGHFDEILQSANQHLRLHLNTEQFTGIDKKIAVMQLLKVNDIGFLFAIMPRLLNLNLANVDNEELLKIRDLYLIDYKNSLPWIENSVQMVDECDVILKKESSIKSIKEFSHEEFEGILKVFKQVNRYADQSSEFPSTNRYIAVMEMFNRNGLNIDFLRRVFSRLLNNHFATQHESILYALRDRITDGYMGFLDKKYLHQVATQLIDNVDDFLEDGSASDTSFVRKALQLSTQIAQLEIQPIAAKLGLPLILNKRDREIFCRRLLVSLFEKMSEIGIAKGQSAHVFSKTQQILELDPGVLSETVLKVADEFANRTVHQRISFLFFRERHSETISVLLDELRGMVTKNLSPEQLKLEFIGCLQAFYDKLRHDKEQTPLRALDEVLNAALLSLQIPLESNIGIH